MYLHMFVCDIRVCVCVFVCVCFVYRAKLAFNLILYQLSDVLLFACVFVYVTR